MYLMHCMYYVFNILYYYNYYNLDYLCSYDIMCIKNVKISKNALMVLFSYAVIEKRPVVIEFRFFDFPIIFHGRAWLLGLDKNVKISKNTLWFIIV